MDTPEDLDVVSGTCEEVFNCGTSRLIFGSLQDKGTSVSVYSWALITNSPYW